jgi:diacylglycerol kinase family enzyme
MRVTLIHNPSAGSGSPTRDELLGWLADAGHHAQYQSTRDRDVGRVIDPGSDLVLVAGGDGTVARVLRRLGTESPPIAILPLGTANNIALALGVTDSPRAIIDGLTRARARKLDVGIASSGAGTARFVESAGLGLFASVLRDARRDEEESNRDAGERDLRWGRGNRMRRMLASEPVEKRTIEADGKDLSGECVFVAVLNMPFIGPRIALAPDADPTDGYLDLLIVRPDDRRMVDDFLEAVTEDPTVACPLPTHRCREVHLMWEDDAGHLDDRTWPDGEHSPAAAPNGARVSLAISPAVLRVVTGGTS